MKLLLSFIVPVYNAGRYVGLMLDSLRSQQGADYEILLIDDGSTDDSGAICQQAAAADARVRYFHQENGGVSSARNLGIEQAKGDWLCFVDSDDLVGATLVAKCAPYMTDDNDVVFFSMTKFFKDDASDLVLSGDPPTAYTCDREDILRIVANNICMKEFLSKTKLHFYSSRGVSAMMMKRSIFMARDLRLNTQMRLGEDITCRVRYLATCQRGVCVSDSLYFYRCTGASLTHRYTPEIDREVMMILEEFRQTIARDYHDDPTVLQAFWGATVVESMWVLVLNLAHPSCPLTLREREEALARYKQQPMIAEGLRKAQPEQFIRENRDFFEAFALPDAHASYRRCCAVLKRNAKREVQDVSLKKLLKATGLYPLLKKLHTLLKKR